MTTLEAALEASVMALETGRLLRRDELVSARDLTAVHAQLSRACREPFTEAENEARAARLAEMTE